MYSTVKLVSVRVPKEYCVLKSAVAVILVTCAVPLPVMVPDPRPITLVAPGVKTTPEAIVTIPVDEVGLKLILVLKPLVLLMLTLLVVMEEAEPEIEVAAGVAGVLKLIVPAVRNE